MMQTFNPALQLPLSSQRGVALITGLIFMVVLTLLVVAAMRTTSLEEKMAGNARDVNIAFQAGEAALRAGEKVLNGASLPAFATTGPYLKVAMRDDTYWTTTHNWATNSVLYPSIPNGAAAAPRFVIEELEPVASAGFTKKAGPLAQKGYYRIIARGVGGNINTVVYVESTYRR